jgi:hypothetical protein
MKMKIENLSVKQDRQCRFNRGYYIVDTTSNGHKYLNKQGELQEGVLANDCWWETRKEAMGFVLDLCGEGNAGNDSRTLDQLLDYLAEAHPEIGIRTREDLIERALNNQ